MGRTGLNTREAPSTLEAPGPYPVNGFKLRWNLWAVLSCQCATLTQGSCAVPSVHSLQSCGTYLSLVSSGDGVGEKKKPKTAFLLSAPSMNGVWVYQW